MATISTIKVVVNNFIYSLFDFSVTVNVLNDYFISLSLKHYSL